MTLIVPEWHADAACRPGRDASPDWFYFPDGAGRGAPTKAKYEIPAKTTCWQCPVRTDCLTDALRRNERYGIWGGYNEYERAEMLRQIKAKALTEALRQVTS